MELNVVALSLCFGSRSFKCSVQRERERDTHHPLSPSSLNFPQDIPILLVLLYSFILFVFLPLQGFYPLFQINWDRLYEFLMDGGDTHSHSTTEELTFHLLFICSLLVINDHLVRLRVFFHKQKEIEVCVFVLA